MAIESKIAILNKNQYKMEKNHFNIVEIQLTTISVDSRKN